MALFSSRITELEGQLATLTAERDSFAAANKDLTEANEQLGTQNKAHTDAIATLSKERDDAQSSVQSITSERDKAQADLKAANDSRDKAIADGIRDGIAAAGVPAVKRDPAAADPKSQPAAGGTSTLHGRAKAVAAINAQFSK